MAEKAKLTGVSITVVIDDNTKFSGSLWSEHGLSLLIDLQWEGFGPRRILYDTGTSPEVLTHNLEYLEVTPESIDTVFLSHSHYDHTGGLSALTKAEDADFNLVAHEKITRPVYRHVPELGYQGMKPEDLAGVPPHRRLFFSEPTEIYPEVYITGSIPRETDFEKPGRGQAALWEGRLIPDNNPDDMSMIFKTGQDCAAIITGCCHSGLINTIRHARNVVGTSHFEAVMGGLHLIKASEERLQKTVENLEDFEIDRLITGHCTGAEAQQYLDRHASVQHIPFYTGDSFHFGS